MHRPTYLLPLNLSRSSLELDTKDQNFAHSRSILKKRWVHGLPVFVLLCFFVLCWFSYPVELEIKDGGIAAIHRVDDMLHSLGNKHVELAGLASASSAETSVAPTLQTFVWG